ncbi:MAG: RidA family protein [bacterium]|nr:RidA family protein [bacterium]
MTKSTTDCWKVPNGFQQDSSLPFSPAAELPCGIIQLSGIIAPLGDDGRVRERAFAAQVTLIFEAISRRLQVAGLNVTDVFHLRVFLATGPEVEAAFNRLYERIMERVGIVNLPTRTMIGVAWLPKGAQVEIEVHACRPSSQSE